MSNFKRQIYKVLNINNNYMQKARKIIKNMVLIKMTETKIERKTVITKSGWTPDLLKKIKTPKLEIGNVELVKRIIKKYRLDK